MSARHLSPELPGHGDGVGSALVQFREAQSSRLCCFRWVVRKADESPNLVRQPEPISPILCVCVCVCVRARARVKMNFPMTILLRLPDAHPDSRKARLSRGTGRRDFSLTCPQGYPSPPRVDSGQEAQLCLR